MSKYSTTFRRSTTAESAVVDRRKVLEYLLNAAHPDNGGKARFFEGLGFSGNDPSPLVAALGGVATSGEVVERVESPHGEKYLVDGPLESPTGRKPLVRTVWIMDRGEQAPRLVTAFILVRNERRP